MKKILSYIIVAIVCLAIGFGSGYEYVAYKVKSALAQAMKPLDKKVGDEIVLDTGKVMVNSVNETQTLSSSFSNPTVASEGTKFVVINLTLTNITNSDFTFSPDEAFTLVDNKSREYHAFSNQLSTDLTYKSLSPSVPVTGTIVYQLPTDATGYDLATSKTSTKELYKIVLK